MSWWSFVDMSELSSAQWFHHYTDAPTSHSHWSVENGFWAWLCHNCDVESIRRNGWGILAVDIYIHLFDVVQYFLLLFWQLWLIIGKIV